MSIWQTKVMFWVNTKFLFNKLLIFSNIKSIFTKAHMFEHKFVFGRAKNYLKLSFSNYTFLPVCGVIQKDVTRT